MCAGVHFMMRAVVHILLAHWKKSETKGRKNIRAHKGIKSNNKVKFNLPENEKDGQRGFFAVFFIGLDDVAREREG